MHVFFMKSKTAVLVSGVLGLCCAASAAELVTYAFDASAAPDYVDPGVAATAIGAMNVVGGASGGVGVYTQWDGTGPNAIEFTLTPTDPTQTFALDTLSFDVWTENLLVSPLFIPTHAPFTWYVGLYVGANAIPAFIAPLTIGGNMWYTTPEVDLTSLVFNPGDSFRVVIEGIDANNGDRKAKFDNITVEGALIPEPASFSVIAGLGLVAFGAMRRVRRVA